MPHTSWSTHRNQREHTEDSLGSISVSQRNGSEAGSNHAVLQDVLCVRTATQFPPHQHWYTSPALLDIEIFYNLPSQIQCLHDGTGKSVG